MKSISMDHLTSDSYLSSDPYLADDQNGPLTLIRTLTEQCAIVDGGIFVHNP